jgi:hypothetical protein
MHSHDMHDTPAIAFSLSGGAAMYCQIVQHTECGNSAVDELASQLVALRNVTHSMQHAGGALAHGGCLIVATRHMMIIGLFLVCALQPMAPAGCLGHRLRLCMGAAAVVVGLG